MQSIIDTAFNVGPFANRLVDEGVKCVLRYYNNENSAKFPDKCLTKHEAEQLLSAGLSLAVVYQQRGGAPTNRNDSSHLEDFSKRYAERDATQALKHARINEQTQGSAIYFAVDWDFHQSMELLNIMQYFETINRIVGDEYRIGVHGSGTLCSRLKKEGLAEYFRLPNYLGWSGSREAYMHGEWTLYQGLINRRELWGGFDYSGNQFNPAYDNFGQWRQEEGNVLGRPQDFHGRDRQPICVTYQVAARGGLNLRRGPGLDYPVEQTIASESIIYGKSQDGDWILVDLQGDGRPDGYMNSNFLTRLSGGYLESFQHNDKPYDIAKAELLRNALEFSRGFHNPRIVLYHARTKGDGAMDEANWGSSFINFCVSCSGYEGPDDKSALSWHETNWGKDVTKDSREGDIVILSRKKGDVAGGHVGFLVEDLDDRLRILGGDSANKISIKTYPKNGEQEGFTYKVLSIRR